MNRRFCLHYAFRKFTLIYIMAKALVSEGSVYQQYLGCFTDNVCRSSSSTPPINKYLTIESCITECRKGDRTYSRAQNGTVCECTDEYGGQLPDSCCTMSCSGNHLQYCGGTTDSLSTIYSLYTVCSVGYYGSGCDQVCHCRQQTPCDRKTGLCLEGCDGNYTGPSCNSSELSSLYIGCFGDIQEDRAMGTSALEYYRIDSLEECKTLCARNDSSYAGAEYGGECYCAEHYDKHGRLNESRCEQPCIGSPTQICGGPNAISVYSVCPVGSYGNNCLDKCNCFNDSRCVYRNGSCPLSQCKPGWIGTSCSERDCTMNNGDCRSEEKCLSVQIGPSTIVAVCRRNTLRENCAEMLTYSSTVSSFTENPNKGSSKADLGIGIAIGLAIGLVLGITSTIATVIYFRRKQSTKNTPGTSDDRPNRNGAMQENQEPDYTTLGPSLEPTVHYDKLQKQG